MTVKQANEIIEGFADIAVTYNGYKKYIKLNRYSESLDMAAYGDFVVDEIQFDTNTNQFVLYLKCQFVRN